MYQDIPRLYSAIAEFAAAFIIIRSSGAIKKKKRFAVLSVIFFFTQALWMVSTGRVPTVFWIPCMLITIALMGIFICLSVDAPLLNKLYMTLKAFLAAEFIASLEWQIDTFFRSRLAIDLSRSIVSLMIMAITLVMSGILMYQIEKSMNRDDFGMEIGKLELLITALITLIAFTLSNMSFVSAMTPFSGTSQDIYNIRTLFDLSGLAILYAYQYRMIEVNTEKKLARMNMMLRMQYEHYRNYQETIDRINIKYHDLKHQLTGLRTETDSGRRSKWIDSLEKELEGYRPDTQTGNRVLDGILDEKSSVIRKNNIEFTCVCDGSLLNDMHVTDICTIFGNALDNAIENVSLEPDPDKRLIHLLVNERKNFLYIEIDNTCSNDLKIQNGYPMTTKQDRENHGFGVRSIDYAVQKYSGSVNFSVDKGMFRLKILIPIMRLESVKNPIDH